MISTSLIVVTARYHMPRALREFSAAMPDVKLAALSGGTGPDRSRRLVAASAHRFAAALRICEISGQPGHHQHGAVMTAVAFGPVHGLVSASDGRAWRSFFCRFWRRRAAPRVWMARHWARATLWGLKVFAGIGMRQIGEAPKGPVLVASKHMSMWDTLALYLALDDPGIVLKRELLRIPFYGWYLWKVAAIPIDRGAGAEALRRMTRAAERVLAEGRPILIFPEGTRKKPGAPAGLQARRGGALWPAGRALRAGGAQFRPLLARLRQKSRHHQPSIPGADSARPEAARLHGPAAGCHRNRHRPAARRGTMKAAPGKTCGACTACCVELRINTPEFKKDSHVPCAHLTASGCGIYQDRFKVCRQFLCGWLLSAELGEDWRPDRSGVLLMQGTQTDLPKPYQAAGHGVLMLISRRRGGGHPPRLCRTCRLSWSRAASAVYLTTVSPKTLVNDGSGAPGGGKRPSRHNPDAAASLPPAGGIPGREGDVSAFAASLSPATGEIARSDKKSQ